MPSRKVVLALASSLAFVSLLAAADTKEIHRTLPLSVGGTVSLENHKGSIKVTAWDRPEVEIHAVIQAEPGTTMNRRSFEGTDVVIEAASGSVQIRSKYPASNDCCSDNDSSPEVKYEIQMPRTAHLRVRDHRSASEISGIGAGLDFDTHRGSLRVMGLSGDLKIATHRGEVQVGVVSLGANSSITTHRGNVELTMPRGSQIQVKSEMDKRASFQSDFSNSAGGPTLRVQSHRGKIRIRAV